MPVQAFRRPKPASDIGIAAFERKTAEAARLLLKENRHSISEIGEIVGYEDHSAFSRAFRRHVGRTPKEWRRFQGG